MQVAVRLRSEELIELLSEFGANLDATALANAAQQGHHSLADVLVKCGAKANVPECDGGFDSALGAALKSPRSRSTMIQYLDKSLRGRHHSRNPMNSPDPKFSAAPPPTEVRSP